MRRHHPAGEDARSVRAPGAVTSARATGARRVWFAVSAVAMAMAAPPLVAHAANQSVSIEHAGKNGCATGSGGAGNSYCYIPGGVGIGAGETVTWVNNSANTHTVTRCSGAACPSGPGTGTASDAFSSPRLGSASTWAHSFNGAGTYNYYCTIHGYAVMHGSVTVTGTAATPTPTPTPVPPSTPTPALGSPSAPAATPPPSASAPAQPHASAQPSAQVPGGTASAPAPASASAGASSDPAAPATSAPDAAEGSSTASTSQTGAEGSSASDASAGSGHGAAVTGPPTVGSAAGSTRASGLASHPWWLALSLPLLLLLFLLLLLARRRRRDESASVEPPAADGP